MGMTACFHKVFLKEEKKTTIKNENNILPFVKEKFKKHEKSQKTKKLKHEKYYFTFLES